MNPIYDSVYLLGWSAELEYRKCSFEDYINMEPDKYDTLESAAEMWDCVACLDQGCEFCPNTD